MVVFTCGHCGESIQKPKVEKHYLTKCRNQNPNLSCMDCFKDFLGNDYVTHIKCITEEQRYSGKGFVAKEKKGEKKQNAWVEILQSVLDEQKTAPKNVLRIVEAISKHNNTPRKKPKFINFVKNVCGSKTNPKDIDQAWDLISVKLSELSNVTNGQNESVIEQDKKNDTITPNGNSNDSALNGGTDVDKENKQNGKTEANSENVENAPEIVDDKKMTKKQRKEEKKRRKYEAELQSAAAAPEPIEQEVEADSQVNKKNKKKKNKSEQSTNGDVVGDELVDNKNKKRKRQDTVNCVADTSADIIENTTVETDVIKVKSLKKKLKMEGEDEAEESICLHDQNVAHAEEDVPKKDKFDWHAVILSVLQKKGDEIQFKRLQKKVLAEYSEATGMDVDDRIAEKFIKKLRSAPNVRVDKNRVLLLE